jgi:hypothetical protein
LQFEQVLRNDTANVIQVFGQSTHNRTACAPALFGAQRGCTEIMERAQDGFETRLLDGKTLDAANDPVIAGAHPHRGWDPFEIWRTRVRSMRLKHPREGKDSQD